MMFVLFFIRMTMIVPKEWEVKKWQKGSPILSFPQGEGIWRR
jgi:hypothetical protein